MVISTRFPSFECKLHHFLQRKKRKASFAEGGDPRLIDSQNVCGLGLSEFTLSDDLVDPPCDLGLGQGGVRVWNPYVGENVPRTLFAFDFPFHGFFDVWRWCSASRRRFLIKSTRKSGEIRDNDHFLLATIHPRRGNAVADKQPADEGRHRHSWNRCKWWLSRISPDFYVAVSDP
jgi:hypothetical protein